MMSTPTTVSKPVASEGSASWISQTPGVCGGDACIRSTRIPVWLLEGWRRLGLADAEILAQYPGLTVDDLVAAWDYAGSHPEEIEAAIRGNEED
jgi:uncharacterized protein (DUF433 family)